MGAYLYLQKMKSNIMNLNQSNLDSYLNKILISKLTENVKLETCRDKTNFQFLFCEDFTIITMS